MEKLNWKFIVITSLAAAFISILSGLIGGVGVGSILIRALFVIILFALFSAAVNLVAVNFLDGGDVAAEPGESPPGEQEGSRVNIVLNEDDSAVSVLPAEEDTSVGTAESNETQPSVESGDSSLGSRSTQVDLEMATSADIDSLPDLGSFSTSFSSPAGEEEKKTDAPEESGYNESASFSSGSKLSPEGIAGIIAEQNSPEDIAKAVKTVMNKEETK